MCINCTHNSKPSTHYFIAIRQAKEQVFVSTNVSKNRVGRQVGKTVFALTSFTVQPLAIYKCENTASNVNTSKHNIHVEYDNRIENHIFALKPSTNTKTRLGTAQINRATLFAFYALNIRRCRCLIICQLWNTKASFSNWIFITFYV